MPPLAIPPAADLTSSKLNPAQLEAVEEIDGPVRIMAGAGTGKTTVIIRRIANIIRKGKARPEEILAVTFTRKAAGEMRQRLGALLGDDVARRLSVGNFHATSSEMLRRHSHLLGLPSRFTVLDDDGQRNVIADLAMKLGYLGTKKDKVKIMRYQAQISSWKEDGLVYDRVLSESDLTTISQGPNHDDPDFLIKCARVFHAYQVELEARRWCDFADLVLHMVRLFRDFPDVLQEEAGRYRYLMVDEFQDTSPVQNEWVTWMARDHKNICVVGDTDQSIYEWRNARPEIMLNFARIWKGAKTITIDTNYRSTQEILDIANTVVKPLRAKDGLEKVLKGIKTGIAPQDFVRGYDSGFEEADTIADNIRSKIDNGEMPSEIAILCRSGMIITGIERALRERGLRYIVAGAMKFTDREEVKDAIAWLTLAVNPMDYIAFSRIASKPRRGLGPQKVGELRRLMMENAWTVREAAGAIADAAKKGSANARNFTDLCQLLDHLEAIIQNGANAGAMLEDILDESGYMEWREGNDTDPQRDQRIENLTMIIDEAQAMIRHWNFSKCSPFRPEETWAGAMTASWSQRFMPPKAWNSTSSTARQWKRGYSPTHGPKRPVTGPTKKDGWRMLPGPAPATSFTSRLLVIGWATTALARHRATCRRWDFLGDRAKVPPHQAPGAACGAALSEAISILQSTTSARFRATPPGVARFSCTVSHF